MTQIDAGTVKVIRAAVAEEMAAGYAGKTKILSVKDFAKKLGVGKNTAYDIANSWVIGEPAQMRIGRSIKFNESVLDRWLENADNVKKLRRF